MIVCDFLTALLFDGVAMNGDEHSFGSALIFDIGTYLFLYLVCWHCGQTSSSLWYFLPSDALLLQWPHLMEYVVWYIK